MQQELMETRTARPFSFSFNTSDYRILLMDQDQDRLYLGSREYVVALDMQNVNKEPLIIHWPASVQRRGECRMAGKGEQGECANYVRLVEPWNRTHLYACGTGAYSPVCTFINRGWKSEEYLFRLVPGKAESGKGKCPYDPRQENVALLVGDMFIQPTQDERNPVLYAVFSTTGSVFKGSAVCVYSMSDIRTVFNGPFSHKQGHNYQWTPYAGKIPYPRPGTCPGGTFTPGIRTTKDFSDEVVNFIRTHPLMYLSVYPLNRRPLVVRTGVDYRFTTIAVDQVDAVDGRYEVLFLGTDRGTVQKVIVLPKDPSTTEELILEEVEVFKTSAPVKTMKISSKRQQLYVSSEGGLTQVSLHRCGVYGKACSDCCLARDPYCAWDGENCAPFTPATKRRSRRQDIKYGDPLRQCRGFNAKVEKRLGETSQFGVEGSTVFLECQPRSPQASIKWLFQKDGTGRRKVLNRDREVLKTGLGILLKGIRKEDSGLYHCVATENNFKHTVARVALRVLDREIVDALTTPDIPIHSQSIQLEPTPHSSVKTPPHIVGQPEIRLINQYCESYWHQLNPAQRPKRTSRHDDVKDIPERRD
ncbi:SEM3F protein, partial [Polypterus senegalus]